MELGQKDKSSEGYQKNNKCNILHIEGIGVAYLRIYRQHKYEDDQGCNYPTYNWKGKFIIHEKLKSLVEA